MNTKNNQGLLDYVDDGVAMFEKTFKRIAGIEAISMALSLVVVITAVVFFIFLGAMLSNDTLLTQAILTGDAASYLTSGAYSRVFLYVVIISLVSGILLTMIRAAMDLAKIMALMKGASFAKSFGFGIKNVWKGFLLVLGRHLLIFAAMLCTGIPAFMLLNALVPSLGLEQWSPASSGSLQPLLYFWLLRSCFSLSFLEPWWQHAFSLCCSCGLRIKTSGCGRSSNNPSLSQKGLCSGLWCCCTAY